MRCRHAIVLLPATTLALSLQTQAPPRVVVDLGVVADTLPLESEVYLSAAESEAGGPGATSATCLNIDGEPLI